MILFFTFVVDIGKHTKLELLKSLDILVNSIKRYVPEFKILVFTNFDIIKTYRCVEYRSYYDKSVYKLYNDKWLNLSFNKINIFRDLYDEFNESFTWIDLDTFITHDISYLEGIDNVFMCIGGHCTQSNPLFKGNNMITIPRHQIIQGDFWKINIEIYDNVMSMLRDLQQKGLTPIFDLQSLFCYYIYTREYRDVNVIGYNYKMDTVNGLSVWSKDGNTHATVNGLHNIYKDEDDVLRTRLYNNKEIHILSFTFNSLKTLWNDTKFKDILC